jgi:hypothetical protein
VSKSLGPRLPNSLLARLGQHDLAGRLGTALPFATVDAQGRPHPMLLSYVEVRAYDPSTLGLVIGTGSTGAKNLAAGRPATLLIVEPDAVVYLKLCPVDGPLAVPGGEAWTLGYFLLEVTDVLEDSAAEWEGGAAITSSVVYRPAPTLDTPWARATLAGLAAPRARA